MFDQMFRKNDDSERLIRTNIDSIIAQIEDEGLDYVDDATMIRKKLPLDDE